MTMIIRKANIIATDSKEFISFGTSSGSQCARYIKQKMYRHPTNKAIIAYTGEFTTSDQFETVAKRIDELILTISLGERPPCPPDNYFNETIFGGKIAVFTKQHTYILSMTGLNDEKNPMFWKVADHRKPVIMGSAEAYIDIDELFDPEVSVKQCMDTVYHLDEMVGGNRYFFDLNQLNDVVDGDKQ